MNEVWGKGRRDADGRSSYKTNYMSYINPMRRSIARVHYWDPTNNGDQVQDTNL